MHLIPTFLYPPPPPFYIPSLYVYLTAYDLHNMYINSPNTASHHRTIHQYIPVWHFFVAIWEQATSWTYFLWQAKCLSMPLKYLQNIVIYIQVKDGRKVNPMCYIVPYKIV